MEIICVIEISLLDMSSYNRVNSFVSKPLKIFILSPNNVIKSTIFQEENRQLVERLIRYKAKDADKMNEENDNFLK